MQQRSCEQIGLLLSKYADGEATPAERARVESHVASCADCSRKLAEFSQLASIFSGPPMRDPEPSLRVDLFRQIREVRQEEEEARKRAEERLSWLPRLPHRVPRRNLASRAWSAASPFMVASAAIFTL